MHKRTVSFDESLTYLSAWGNDNIIRNHLAYFEKKLKDEITTYRNEKIGGSLALYPNFAAWIRLYTELICNSLYWRLFRYEGDWEKIDKIRYRDITDYLIKIIAQETEKLKKDMDNVEVNSMKEAICLIIRVC